MKIPQYMVTPLRSFFSDLISTFSNIQISSIVTCVPPSVNQNVDLPFDTETIQKVSDSSGIDSRRICDPKTTSSDLCVKAAKQVLTNSKIEIREIGVLIFVTQYPDYILPSIAHEIKVRLGLPMSTIAMQINEGCSGYLYGMQMCLSLMESTKSNYGLLLAGDTTSRVLAEDDSGTRPIFGDAGSASLFSKGEGEIKLQLGSDGSGFEDIIIKKGGFRNPVAANEDSGKLEMNGMNVFMFGISRIPKYILEFCSYADIKISEIDYLVLHQANRLMNSRIVKKIGADKRKALYSLKDFGNTSSASIPLTITSNLKGQLVEGKKILSCGFGVGLSWGTASFSLSQDTYLDNIEF